MEVFMTETFLNTESKIPSWSPCCEDTVNVEEDGSMYCDICGAVVEPNIVTMKKG